MALPNHWPTEAELRAAETAERNLAILHDDYAAPVCDCARIRLLLRTVSRETWTLARWHTLFGEPQ